MWQVSSGAIDLAKANLQSMLVQCAREIPADKVTEELVAAQKRSLFDVTHELVTQVTVPNTLVRETVRSFQTMLCLFFNIRNILL